MIKNIPKSAVWRKSFPVYKKFTLTKEDSEVISGSLEVGDFDTGSFNKQGTIFTHPLLKSITSKYYHPDTNPFTLFGEVPDPAVTLPNQKFSFPSLSLIFMATLS